jgi:hypothetical protein
VVNINNTFISWLRNPLIDEAIITPTKKNDMYNKISKNKGTGKRRGEKSREGRWKQEIRVHETKGLYIHMLREEEAERGEGGKRGR